MYSLLIENSTKKDFDNINQSDLKRIAVKINELKDDPRPSGTIKLKGSSNDWRIIIGDYRVVYEIDDDLETVIIYRIKHRKDAYKKKQ